MAAELSHPLVWLHPGAQRDMVRWRAQSLIHLNQLPRIKAHVLDRVAGLDRTDYVGANLEVARMGKVLKRARVNLAFSEAQIIAHAESNARACSRRPLLANRIELAAWYGVEEPQGHGMTGDGKMRRLEDPLWWRRQLRRVWTRAGEDEFRRLGIVRRSKAAYVSEENLTRRAGQKKRLHEFFERHDVLNQDTGERIALDALAAHSLANPANRLGELMTRARGFEEIAALHGHVAVFVTLTCPSAFHPQLAAGGENPAYTGATARDAQAWLCKMWARARAKLHRKGIKIYGFRVAEPHHDGTPHWHALLFARAVEMDVVCAVVRGVWLSEFAGEPGAGAHRTKVETVDPAKGSPCGYLAKYLSKNLTGKGAIGDERSDEHEGTVTGSTARVDAWASTHGIRQFQQIGGPPVGLWREMRRLRVAVADPDIERTRRCADRGRFCGFVQCVGGIHVGRRTNLRLERVERGDRNRYAELRPAQIIGIKWSSVLEITRPHRWRIEKKATVAPSPGASRTARKVRSDPAPVSSALGPVAITVREASPALNLPPVGSRAGPREGS